MTRFSKLLLAAALGGTALAGTAYAAQDQAAPAPHAGMHRHHRGHGDMLAKLDTNKDGVITKAEAITAADAHFAKGDTNGDGQITQDEVKAKHDAMRAKWQARQAAKAGDDQSAEGQKMAGRRHGMHHRGGMVMKHLDANNDGTVTKAEAETAATARFDKVDANRDGTIDQTEVAAAKQQMQARMAQRRAKWQARRAAQGDAAPTAQPAPAGQ